MNLNRKDFTHLKLNDNEIKEKWQFIKDKLSEIINLYQSIITKYSISWSLYSSENSDNRQNVEFELLKKAIEIQIYNEEEISLTEKFDNRSKSLEEVYYSTNNTEWEKDENITIIIKNKEDINLLKDNNKYLFSSYDIVLNNDLFEYLNNILRNNINISNIDFSIINFDTKIAFSLFIAEQNNKINKEISLINKELANLKVEVEKELYNKWILNWEVLPNGKFYIKYNKGDFDIIDNDPRLLELYNKKKKIEDSINYNEWYNPYELLKIYDKLENIFNSKIYKSRENDLNYNFIPEQEFINSRIEKKIIIDKLMSIKYNKATMKILSEEFANELFNKFYFEKYNYDSKSLLLEEQEIKDIETYNIIHNELYNELKNENVISESSRIWYKNRKIKNKFFANPNYKSLYNKKQKIQNKLEIFQKESIFTKISQLKELYSNYKNEYIVNKDVFLWVEWDFNSIVLYNNSLDFIEKNTYEHYQFRCYEYDNCWDDYCRWIMLVKNKDDLISKVQEKYGIKVFDWAWTKKYKEEWYKKLWTWQHHIYHWINIDDLKISICKECWKWYKNINKINNYFCSEECSNKFNIKHTHISTSKNYNIDNIKISSNVNIEGIIDNNEDILKDDEIIYSEAIIYKITNKITNKVYIWKTEQNFTTRWYQHFNTWNTKSPFKDDIKQHWLNSFNFEIIEEIYKSEIESDLIKFDSTNFANYVLIREQYYIDKYDSFNNWYNRRNNFKK